MNPRNIQHGAVAGIAGGIVFGAMMAMMGMLPMIGQMVGSPTAEREDRPIESCPSWMVGLLRLAQRRPALSEGRSICQFQTSTMVAG